ncbi:hypothetical protein CYMTET_23234 [Cymbomonas tetramitiformis]|uniref:Cyclic nucleotide-binding domain-containing protein n=1 Tax=Cymbomonas tetramitiformis TaxID=36881 RepID=A0AAE0FYU3_9CHLO|nr:hypothetical protein CYMTET_23234 [Cymbomonas tetramitiformis]
MPSLQREPKEIEKVDKLLCHLEFFKQFPQGLRLRLLRSMQYEVLPQNSLVCEQGDVGDAMYVIMSGTCAVHVKSSVADSIQKIDATAHRGKSNSEAPTNHADTSEGGKSRDTSLPQPPQRLSFADLGSTKPDLSPRDRVRKRLTKVIGKIKVSNQIHGMMKTGRGTAENDHKKRKAHDPRIAYDEHAMAHHYGQRVAGLGIGKHFGELALLSTSDTRTATILTEMPVEFMKITRAVYDATLRQLQLEQLRSKMEFLSRCALFSMMDDHDKSRNQLITTDKVYPRGFTIVEEGDPLKTVYFVVSGSVSLTHKCQPKAGGAGAAPAPREDPSAGHAQPWRPQPLLGETGATGGGGGAVLPEHGSPWPPLGGTAHGPLKCSTPRGAAGRANVVEVAIVGKYDCFGEEFFAEAERHQLTAVTQMETKIMAIKTLEFTKMPASSCSNARAFHQFRLGARKERVGGVCMCGMLTPPAEPEEDVGPARVPIAKLQGKVHLTNTPGSDLMHSVTAVHMPPAERYRHAVSDHKAGLSGSVRTKVVTSDLPWAITNAATRDPLPNLGSLATIMSSCGGEDEAMELDGAVSERSDRLQSVESVEPTWHPSGAQTERASRSDRVDVGLKECQAASSVYQGEMMAGILDASWRMLRPGHEAPPEECRSPPERACTAPTMISSECLQTRQFRSSGRPKELSSLQPSPRLEREIRKAMASPFFANNAFGGKDAFRSHESPQGRVLRTTLCRPLYRNSGGAGFHAVPPASAGHTSRRQEQKQHEQMKMMQEHFPGHIRRPMSLVKGDTENLLVIPSAEHAEYYYGEEGRPPSFPPQEYSALSRPSTHELRRKPPLDCSYTQPQPPERAVTADKPSTRKTKLVQPNQNDPTFDTENDQDIPDMNAEVSLWETEDIPHSSDTENNNFYLTQPIAT